MDKLKKIWKQDKYISYNEYLNFCEKNNYIPNKVELQKRNDKYIEKKLIKEKEYLDTIFTNAGENIILDEEQRRIIIRDDDYCLINAGAGAGKSTTMAAKVKYLVDKQNINPKDIIMLSFTKKSSEDLDEKVNLLLDLGIPVSTFHSLGMKFIRKSYSVPIKIAGEDEQKKIIQEYIIDIFRDKKKLSDVIFLFRKFGNKEFITRGFWENFDKFDSFDEYFKDYKKRKYEKEKNKSIGIEGYVENRLKSEKNLYTIKGEKCKSLAEVKIANFLFINGIDYTYEKVFEEKVDEDRSYSPDFTIEANGKKIYIEYYGLSSFFENNELTQRGIQRYNRIRKRKEIFQKQNNYDFINLDYKTPDGTYIDTLEKELIKRNITFNKKTYDELFDRIMNNNLQAEYFKFSELVIKFINILKNMLVDDVNYIFEKRINEIKKEKFKYLYYSNDLEQEANYRIKALLILKEIYSYYQEYLTKYNMVDYDDMINKTYKFIIQDMRENNKDWNYKYVIVDEYQDITFQRFLFVKRLVEYYGAKLISVGDDWQSIYSFTGSRLELFNKFSETFNNSKDDMLLSTTYRYGQELVDISSNFIVKNKEQSDKKIKSIKHLENPIEILEYAQGEEEKTIYEIIKTIYQNNSADKILLLARTNECLRKITETQYFKKGVDDIIICKDMPDAKVEGITIHRSKGLTADQVIVFGLRDNIFPTKGKSEHWIFDYFRLDTIEDNIQFVNIIKDKENYPYAEERRLFYVAITRTKNKVYLVVPSSPIQVTPFVNEIREECE